MLVPTRLLNLANTLRLADRELVSLVGGGGKTTSLFALGSQLRGRVVLTTTTKMGSERTGDIRVLVAPEVADVAAQVDEQSPVLVWDGVDGRKALGVSPDRCDQWFAHPFIDSVVVEADGSRKRPFKAPRSYEPVVPSSTTVLVACIGSGAMGRIIADSCQRPDRVAAIAGCSIHDILTPQRAATVLIHEDGSQKSRPSHARFVIAAHRVRPEQEVSVRHLAAAVEAIDDSIEVVAVAEQDEHP